MDIYILFLFICLYPTFVCVKKINYIKEPAQLRINPINRPISTDDLHLTARVRPSHITVPAYLGVLRGQCFTKVIDDYRYNLCPFENVTQYEQSFKWNPYSGIMGIWKDWIIEGNEFKEMMMSDGDDCGSKRRQTRVRLVCSQNDASLDAQIVSVLEPTTCEYLMTVATHLTCFNHSLNVYPFLPQTFQERWDELEGSYQGEELTQKGYETFLRDLLTEAEFLLSQSDEEKRSRIEIALTTATIIEENADVNNVSSTEFMSLHECKEKYSNLSKDFESLQKELNMLKNSTSKHLTPIPTSMLTA